MSSIRRQSSVARSLPVLGLLALFLACGTGLLPLLTAVVAWCDGQHQVRVQSGPDQIKVILAHGRCGQAHPDRCRNHEHDGISSLLSLLADPTPAQADHVLAFHLVSDFRSGPRVNVGLPLSTSLFAAQPVADSDVLVVVAAIAHRADYPPGWSTSGPLSMSVVRLI